MRTKTVDEIVFSQGSLKCKKCTLLSSCDLTTAFYLKHSLYIYIFQKGGQ